MKELFEASRELARILPDMVQRCNCGFDIAGRFLEAVKLEEQHHKWAEEEANRGPMEIAKVRIDAANIQSDELRRYFHKHVCCEYPTFVDLDRIPELEADLRQSTENRVRYNIKQGEPSLYAEACRQSIEVVITPCKPGEEIGPPRRLYEAEPVPGNQNPVSGSSGYDENR